MFLNFLSHRDPGGATGVADAPVTSETPAVEVDPLEAALALLKDPGESAKADEGTPPDPPQAEDPLSLLEKIEEKPAEAPQEAKLSPEQEQVLKLVPDPQTAQQLAQVADGYFTFTEAFNKGNFAAVEQMFETWNPAAFDGFLDYIYEKKVASNEWVDRWVQQKEGKGNPQLDKGMQNLQRQIQSLQNQLANRNQTETTQATQAEQNRIVTAYVGHLDSLFDQINFSKSDRKWVEADIHNRLSQSPAVQAAVKAGQTGAVNGIFKAAVREYVNRDKAVTEEKEAKRDAQAAKKAPLTTSSVPSTEKALPDDIKQVPKGQEDGWMDQQLAKLAAKVKRK
jgi:hypothetical protein